MAEVPGMSSRQRWTLVLVCTAVFMLLLDVTVVSVALPSIQRDLRASLPDLQWVSAAYALVLADHHMVTLKRVAPDRRLVRPKAVTFAPPRAAVCGMGAVR
jgi:hypothetical protein